MRIVARLVPVLVACLSMVVSAEPSGSAIDIGSRRELFVDRFLIDEMKGTAELRLQRPRDEGIVFKFDQPWEGNFCAYFTVVRAIDGRYQMYYRGLGHAGKEADKDGATCYAESRDGKNWEKPKLDLYPGPNGEPTNIILSGAGKVTHNLSVFIDANPACKPEERYKAVGGYDDVGLFAYVSPDGVHWKKLQDAPVLTRAEASQSFAFDSQNVPFWSESERKYVLFYRVYKNKSRRISRMESDDFIHWRNPQLMEYRLADGSPAPIEQLYTNQTHPYFRAPQIYVATAARFMLNRQVVTTQQAEKLGVHPRFFHDTSDAVFMTSRGGYNYDRTFMTGFVWPGIGYENWVSRTNYPALNVVQTGPAEMSLYVNQNYAQPTANLHRYSLRLDGFASVHADYEPGEMVTRVLTFSGSSLMLNFATSAAGGIRVEIQDPAGKAIPGYSLEECQELIGNEIERAVHWTGGDLSKLAGKPVRLRVVMKDADLFAMRFGEEADGPGNAAATVSSK